MNLADRFNWRSPDGTVVAWLEYPAPDICTINEIWAEPRGQGNGRRALQLLRQQFREIRAYSIGDRTNPNRKFWEQMGAEGLIDFAWDGDGQVAWPPAT